VKVLAGARSSFVFEPSDKKMPEFFLVLRSVFMVVLDHAHQVFNKICVRQLETFLFDFGC
jgi:hypothetical protein